MAKIPNNRKNEDYWKAREQAAKGVKEIVLIAQDSTEYGRDIYGKPCLAKLLRELCKVDDIRWIRTLYSYPTYFDDELIETIAEEPKLVKYVDIPMQHAHDEVLRRRPSMISFCTSSGTSLPKDLPTPTTCSAAQDLSSFCSMNLSAPTWHTGHSEGGTSPSCT